jgi:UDP-2,3-diacylglucosamine pyrophosphatase LpxH
MEHYRSVFVSDLHLGTKMSNASAFLGFLRDVETKNLFLVGDIVDGWAMSTRFYWPQEHNDVIQKILRQARKGTKVTYLPGNHDEFLRSFGEHDFGNIRLVDSCVYVGASGKRYKVMHGDQFDVVMKHAKWLMHLGSWTYDMLIALNVVISWARRHAGLRPWSLSAWAKYKVKQAVNFIGDYEDNLSDYASTHRCDGVICGHIHHANIRDINGIAYMNCGDWVESCTALVEHEDGRWELIRWNHCEDNSSN